jgi:opacity protein-like surface antigen
MKTLITAGAAALLACAMSTAAVAQTTKTTHTTTGKKTGFVSFAGSSSQPARNTNNQGTTTGPRGALKNDKTTPNTNLPGRKR